MVIGEALETVSLFLCKNKSKNRRKRNIGLFSNLMGNRGTKPQTKASVGQVELQKVNLEKSTENFGKVLVNLSKSSPVDLTKHMARVAMVFDFSGSMGIKFRDGSVSIFYHN